MTIFALSCCVFGPRALRHSFHTLSWSINTFMERQKALLPTYIHYQVFLGTSSVLFVCLLRELHGHINSSWRIVNQASYAQYPNTASIEQGDCFSSTQQPHVRTFLERRSISPTNWDPWDKMITRLDYKIELHPHIAQIVNPTILALPALNHQDSQNCEKLI